RAPAALPSRIICSRFCCITFGDRPRKPSLPPSSITSSDGVLSSRMAGSRARPPAVVSPLTDAFFTEMLSQCSVRRCSSRLTQPSALSRPKSALILSPSTTRVSALAITPIHSKPTETRLRMQNSPLLDARGVGKSAPGPEGVLRILDNIYFQVKAGESVAITGPSGSGKSTLLGLLAGLDVPSEGAVFLDGAPFSSLDEDSRAAKRGALCSFVFQAFHLVSDLTAIENVMLPLQLLGNVDAEREAGQWLKRVGLGERQHHFPAQLSGGEQQRVALARAFAQRPRLLFAD